ncbi:putative F-box protein At1g53550 [Dendrobium catenatum]|uniref:putative F-box protein At1g53550 n=1 Tax=Dendrobium catenatum TaxID=906689 RepID=UPI0010A071B5|nr:putative F-box protein At1g53550 [Dendrobium catenatum]
MDNLPVDLVVEILCRLSFKDIMKCRCICKCWQALISNPKFLQYRRQLRLEMQSTSNYKQSCCPIRLLTCSDYYDPCITDIAKKGKAHLHLYTLNNINNEGLGNLNLAPLNKRELKSNTEIVSSSFLKLVLLYDNLSEFLCLHNPSTDEFMTLPKNSDQEDFWLKCVGLGRVESTQEYKVVRVAEYCRGVVCEVFTLGSDYQWREVDEPPINIFDPIPCIFVAGGMYMFEKDYVVILRFDIEAENWMKIPLPNDCPRYRSSWTIREVDGLFCMTGINTGIISMWVLKDYEKGVWALEKRIIIDYNFREFLNDDVEGETLIYPLSFDYGDGKTLLIDGYITAVSTGGTMRDRHR